jgi:hypothetical protein
MMLRCASLALRCGTACQSLLRVLKTCFAAAKMYKHVVLATRTMLASSKCKLQIPRFLSALVHVKQVSTAACMYRPRATTRRHTNV